MLPPIFRLVYSSPSVSAKKPAQLPMSLMKAHTVVLNLEDTNKDMARRILDFLSGVAYANRGKIKRVATNTYIIIPSNVDLTGDDLLDEP